MFVVRGSTGSLHVSAATYINKSLSVSTVRGTLCFSVILVSRGSPAPHPLCFSSVTLRKGRLGVI